MHDATDAPPEIAHRLRRAQAAAQSEGVDALVISVGADLRYLTGYNAHLSERLTAAVIPAVGDPFIVCPQLERPLAAECAAARLGVEVAAWSETDDPYELLTSRLAGPRIALADRMWAQHVFGLRAADSGLSMASAAEIMASLRMVKSPAEIAALSGAAAAIDAVHSVAGELIAVGRTEAAIAHDLARAIVDAGHVSVDFTIVGSGPHGASPHHEFSDRAIEDGDLVVVDIGGEMPDGYRSDSTRTYVVGQSAAYDDVYALVHAAYGAAVDAAVAGAPCASVDAAARQVITDAGLGERFIHRTGHGIGLESHEHPYIVGGNDRVLEPGMTFSIEPGIYLTGEYGARLEDIIVVTDHAAEALSSAPRDLARIEG